ncbi:MAG: 7-cyano-7-deazaguanine synthase QueC [Syntrophomonas sp.]
MKAVALLSGGLDSTVSMLLVREEAEVILALTIDYGQRAALREIEYSRDICREYGIAHRVIELPFMKEFSSGLMEESGLAVNQPWVPNRNGLFLNLAAGFAEDRGAGLVICGFNREEGIDFPDNSREYVSCVNEALAFSTKNGVKVTSMVQGMDKVEIYQAAARLGLKADRMWSCYLGGGQPCNTCPSCLRNMEALKKAGVV